MDTTTVKRERPDDAVAAQPREGDAALLLKMEGGGTLPCRALHHSMLFSDLCKTFEQVARAGDRKVRLRALDALWQSLAGTDFFPFMRLILPQLDTQRATYGLRESKIARYYIDLLGLSQTSPDAERFRHWKDPSKHSVDATHFSDVVFVVLSKRAFVSSASLTVAEVNAHLDHLAAEAAPERKKVTLMTLLRSTSALEQKWVIRIITKEMKMGMQHGSILGAFHPAALELYNNTNDLQYVCQKCTDPKELTVAGDIKSGIFLFQPLKPMLASVVDSAKLSMLLRDERLCVEPKYDGERMMLHVSKDRIAYWTRNARNYTTQYGPKFDQVIRAQLKDVDNCILDGEFLLYDGAAQKFREFGHNRTFAASGVEFDEIDGVKQWFCYCVFDIVFLNGESLVQTPLLKRRETLRSIINVKPTMLEVVPHTVVNTTKSILSALDDSLAKGYEGVLIKIAASHYVPGERKLKWLKLKPDHIAGMADTVDLVILGGYFGVKFGQRHLSHFLLGVWIDKPGALPTDADASFITVCKVGTGYNAADLQELNDRLDGKWLTLPTVPKWLGDWAPAKDDVPDQWIHPRDSVVMEVFGYSFTETTKFSVGHTIRFPRCHRMRYDKDLADATQLSHLRTIISASGTFQRKAEHMDELVMAKRKKGDARREAAAAKVASAMPERTFARVTPNVFVTDASTVPRVSDMFAGFEFCLLHVAPDRADKSALERQIIAHGGIVSANPTRLTSILLATGRDSVKVRHWIAAAGLPDSTLPERYATTDIANVEWLLECFDYDAVLAFAPRHMVFASPQLLETFKESLDEFEDSYFEDANVDAMKKSLALARSASHGPITDAHLQNLRALLAAEASL